MKFLEFLYLMVRAIPGKFGEKMRFLVLSKALGECGKNLVVRENVRFIEVQKMRIGNDIGFSSGGYFDATGGIQIGNNVMFGPGVKMVTSYYDPMNVEKPFYQQKRRFKTITIGDDVWLAANVYVMPGAHLSKGCVVSACSVVIEKEYPPYSILAGNPCRVVGSRV